MKCHVESKIKSHPKIVLICHDISILTDALLYLNYSWPVRLFSSWRVLNQSLVIRYIRTMQVTYNRSFSAFVVRWIHSVRSDLSSRHWYATRLHRASAVGRIVLVVRNTSRDLWHKSKDHTFFSLRWTV